jgi:hypothetical protein
LLPPWEHAHHINQVSFMRMIVALGCVFLSSLSHADVVRHSGVPEHFWGRWAPRADLCRDDKSTVVMSGKAYMTAQERCEVQWVAETPGRNGPIYSAHMRCSSLTMPEQTVALNRIIVPNDSGELSAGPDFKELKSYHRCLRE